MRDIEGGQVRLNMYLGNEFLSYIPTVVQQLNLVLVFERYEMSTYVCEFDYWVLLIGLLKLVKWGRGEGKSTERGRERED